MKEMKLLMEKFNKFLAESNANLHEVSSEKEKFLEAVKKIQDVLNKHELDASGTYSDGYDDYDPYDAIENYNQTLPNVLNDPEFIEAKETLLSLKVSYSPEFYDDADPNKYYEIVDVSIPDFDEGGASDEVYLSLADPDELETRGKRKGKPRIVNSIMIENDYTNAAEMIQDVKSK